MDVQFRLLGPVSVLVHGRPVHLGLRQQRLVLAMLALEANRLVTVDKLVDLLWRDKPPETARRAIHGQVSRLRAVLAKAGVTQQGITVRGEPAGYVLTCEPSDVDAHQFTGLLARARHTDDEVRVSLLDDALALWHGPALAGTVDEVTRAGLCGYLEEARLTAVEDRLAALLRLGRYRGVVDEALRRSAEHPFRHRFTATLMLALQRSGRTADALAAYQQTKHRLADELGLDPPAELTQLHLAILRADDDTTTDTTTPATQPAAPPRPAQLPADIGAFTGRTTELNELVATWPSHSAGARPPAAIEGMAGVGKTAIAIHAAHQLSRHFPDGQLFLDLHGHTRHVPPIEPADALDRLLRALGVPGEQIPSDLDDRAALLRTTLTGRRVLLLLDNAATAAQVRPLLPGAPGCLVLITSRLRLTELDDVHLMSVDVLPLLDAVGLFTSTVGPGRIATTPPQVVADIVELCGRLPLAIRIAAARLQSHPAWTLSHLAERLRDHQHRLDELEAGQRSVTAALNLSYQHLGTEAQRAYRLLGLHPGPDIDGNATAALTDTSAAHAERLLDDLLDAHLLDEPRPGRYTFHDLTRAHAARTCEQHQPETDQKTALRRLVSWYLATVENACHHLNLEPLPRTPADLAAADSPAAGRPPTDFADREAALDWLELERPNLQAIIVNAARHDCHRLVWQLVFAVHPFLQIRKYTSDSRHNLRLGLTAATHDDHRLAQAQALINLGFLDQELGHAASAEQNLQNALALAKETGDRRSQAWTLWGLGIAYWGLGQYSLAEQQHQLALVISQHTGDRRCEAWANGGLGLICMALGQYPRAEQHHREYLTLCRAAGDPYGEAWALCDLGLVYTYTGQYFRAEQHHHEALTIRRQIGDRRGEAWALYGLGLVYSHTGQYPRAEQHLRQALAFFQQASDQYGEAWARNGLGLVYANTGQYPRAEQHHHQALTIRRQIGDGEGEAWALHGLGLVYANAGQHSQAEQHQHQALAIFQQTGTRHGEASSRSAIGDIYLQLGRHEQAEAHLREALTLFEEIGDPSGEAQTRLSLGELHLAAGQTGNAIENLNRAAQIWQRIGVPRLQARALRRLGEVLKNADAEVSP